MPLVALVEELFEQDLLVDDRDATVVNFCRHGSSPVLQQLCDAAELGLVSWRAGRRAWAARQGRKRSGDAVVRLSETAS